MQYLMLLNIILKLVPELLKLIDTLEDMIPAPGHGKTKLELFRHMFTKIVDKSEDITESAETLWPVAVEVVSWLVSVRNSK